MTQEEIAALSTALPDDFSRQVLTGSLMVVNDPQNPIGLNLFAAGVRELFGHILHTFAPDENVRACPWFVQNCDTPTVTRRQRAIFATQGGLNDKYMIALDLEVKDYHDATIKAINTLSKATHVRPGRIISDENTIHDFRDTALRALQDMLETFSMARDTIQGALQDAIYNATGMAFISETFTSIDILAGKGYEIDPWIDNDEMIVTDIGPEQVHLKFSGTAHAKLHYGSRHDATEIAHSFPFWMTFTSPVASPDDLTLTDSHFDDSSWYE